MPFLGRRGPDRHRTHICLPATHAKCVSGAGQAGTLNDIPPLRDRRVGKHNPIRHPQQHRVCGTDFCCTIFARGNMENDLWTLIYPDLMRSQIRRMSYGTWSPVMAGYWQSTFTTTRRQRFIGQRFCPWAHVCRDGSIQFLCRRDWHRRFALLSGRVGF